MIGRLNAPYGTPYSCHRDNVAGDSRLTGPEDRTMSDSYEFATHRSVEPTDTMTYQCTVMVQTMTYRVQ